LSAAVEVGFAVDSEDPNQPPKIKNGGQECPPHITEDAVILFPEGTSIHV
jgi:hypothetical protein